MGDLGAVSPSSVWAFSLNPATLPSRAPRCPMADNDLPSPPTPDDVLLEGLHGDRPLPKTAPRLKAETAGDAAAAYVAPLRDPPAAFPTPEPEAAVQIDLTSEDHVPPHASIVRELRRDEAAGRHAPTVVLRRGSARWRWWLAGAAVFGIGLVAAITLVDGPEDRAPATGASAPGPTNASSPTPTGSPGLPVALPTTTAPPNLAPTPSSARSATPRTAAPLPSGSSPKQDSARVL